MNLLPAGLASVFCLCVIVTQASQAIDKISPGPQEYLNSLIKTIKEIGLADKHTWQLLLHYRSDHLGPGVTSEIDDPKFFFAETGKTDPSAELEATLKAFFSSVKIGKQKLLPQCAFPARYEWLNSQLKFDTKFMPIPKCESIDLWREGINAESVSLVFSSYYFNNPASMFGHTLIRINSADNARPSLLDFAISYAADIGDKDNFFRYAWNGLTGGFKGRFSVYPYYDIVKQYNDLENRDLWEYQLNLSAEQIDFMLLHVWELVNTHFNFYFMRENCSYHLLSLLEVANPELNFRDEYLAWTLPTETLKQVNETPGLVGGIVRRPSLRSQLEKQLKRLNDREKNFVKKLIHGPKMKDSEELALISDIRLAEVVDTAIILSQYQGIANKDKLEEQQRIGHQLMVIRSKLDVESIEIQSPDMNDPVSPDQGHDPFRFAISGGNFRHDDQFIGEKNESFVELTIQPGFHDLLSREDGHAPNSQIRYLGLTARYGEEQKQWQVQELALVDIISLYPVSAVVKEASWKLNVGWEHNQDGACIDCTPFVINPGIGISLQSNMYHREVYFGMLEANLEFDHELDSDHRGGFGATFGLLFDATDQWRIALTANRTRYTEGATSYVSRLELQQRVYYSRNLEFILDLKKIEENKEGKLGFAYYF